MLRMRQYALLAGLIVATVAPSGLADTIGLYFLDGSRMAGVTRQVADAAATPGTALELLTTGPTTEEQDRGLTSAIPQGTTVRQVTVSGAGITVDFSTDLLSRGLDELTTETIFRQVAWTLRPFGLNTDVRLLVDGQMLADYLPPVTRTAPRTTTSLEPPRIVSSLAGHSVTLSPGHGYMWNGSGWHTQRPAYCTRSTRRTCTTWRCANTLKHTCSPTA